jgi:hypothetical protein
MSISDRSGRDRSQTVPYGETAGGPAADDVEQQVVPGEESKMTGIDRELQEASPLTVALWTRLTC